MAHSRKALLKLACVVLGRELRACWSGARKRATPRETARRPRLGRDETRAPERETRDESQLRRPQARARARTTRNAAPTWRPSRPRAMSAVAGPADRAARSSRRVPNTH